MSFPHLVLTLRHGHLRPLRWAVEIMTINEYEYYQENMRNSIIMIFKGIGEGCPTAGFMLY